MSGEVESDIAAEARFKSESLLDSPATQFQVSTLEALIDFLNIQLSDANVYSLNNNVGILKIYSLYPRVTDTLVIQKILIKCLMQLPAPDFTVCLAQVPLHVQSHEHVHKISNLHSLLQSCLFRSFWDNAKAQLDSKPDMTILDVPGLRDSVRRFILDILPLVYQQISVPEMRMLLDFDSNSEEFESLLSFCGWNLDQSYDRNNNEAGSCYSVSRDDVSKFQKGSSQPKVLEKYLRPEAMHYYLSTLHN
ncbi:eukaryotic translation initiation factor 3 subunit, putative [Theileria equi strain WA]|uniref:Eukaryotic translation initiation factor 3 subunit K n=1 Tax=Theileria equi strain WA TaxID=1537102 RepID=L0AV92_THEEQ|nr:eukaryotic translation initiation factor 3 subunit, putative [Theileria equi strain WA]AFZ79168.1 eukaryotic translation initiation factor 3 subunit, putative [Theileria equi strain WA]|eukprot:XP_004828834.1 eukaryotic translation initiation factor 3 subunit, putative [Theileria equi strain WA]